MITSESDFDEIEENKEIEENEFECIKCGFLYNSFTEAEYNQCSNCLIMSCKNCRLNCEECSRNCCHRCSFYLECCSMSKCHHCYGFCENHGIYECNKCIENYECLNCGFCVCKEYISADHKNMYCTDCSYEFCVLCNGNIFVNNYENEENEEVKIENIENEYFPNPCKNCLQDIEKELLKTNIELPVEIIKNILSYIITE